MSLLLLMSVLTADPKPDAAVSVAGIGFVSPDRARLFVPAKVHGRTFRTTASVEGDAVMVLWQANAYYAGGARPTPEIEMAARKEATGVVSIDVKTGNVTVIKRKPNSEDFGTTADAVGEFAFLAEEELPGFRPGVPMTTKMMLSVSKGGSVIWKRELAGNPWSPPPP